MTANEKEQMMIDDILDFMRLAGDIARGAQNHASLLPAVLLIRTM